jgi:hypothetical protein
MICNDKKVLHLSFIPKAYGLELELNFKFNV